METNAGGHGQVHRNYGERFPRVIHQRVLPSALPVIPNSFDFTLDLAVSNGEGKKRRQD